MLKFVCALKGDFFMKNSYDVIIVGAGPAGIMCAYELAEKNNKLKILLLDKGHDIYTRKCPIMDKLISKCPVQKNGFVACNPYCSITNGFGGAGACRAGAPGGTGLSALRRVGSTHFRF